MTCIKAAVIETLEPIMPDSYGAATHVTWNNLFKLKDRTSVSDTKSLPSALGAEISDKARILYQTIWHSCIEDYDSRKRISLGAELTNLRVPDRIEDLLYALRELETYGRCNYVQLLCDRLTFQKDDIVKARRYFLEIYRAMQKVGIPADDYSSKYLLNLDIPGFGLAEIHYLVSDFTGTLSVDGTLLPGIDEQLNELAKYLDIHILTSDTFGTAEKQLEDICCEVHILEGERADVQKEVFVKNLGVDNTVAIGNGNNDRRMLNAAKLGIAVIEGEGCAGDALYAADINVRCASEALELLLNPKRAVATLRF